MHLGIEDALHAAQQQPDAAPRRAHRGGQLRDAGLGGAARRGLGRDLGHRRQPLGQCAFGTETPAGGQQRRQGAQALGVGEGLEQQLAQRALARRALVAALDLRAHALDEAVVAHARGAGGDARHAAQAAVEVRDHLIRHRPLGVEPVVDQHDPPAGRVGLGAPQDVGGAGLQAEPAVHAVVDDVLLGRAVQVKRRHQIPPTNRPGLQVRAGSKRALMRRMSSSFRALVRAPRLARGAQRRRRVEQHRRGRFAAAPPAAGRRRRARPPRSSRPARPGRRACRRRRRRRAARRPARSAAQPTRTSACSGERWPARWRSHSWPSWSVTSTSVRPASRISRAARCARRVASRPAQRASSPPRPAFQATSRASNSSGARARATAAAPSTAGSDAAPSAVTLVSCSGCSRTLTDRISPSVPNAPLNSLARS